MKPVLQGDGGGPLVCESDGQWYQVSVKDFHQHQNYYWLHLISGTRLVLWTSDLNSINTDGHRQLWDWLWKSRCSWGLHYGQDSNAIFHKIFLGLDAWFSGVCFPAMVGANDHQEPEEEEPATVAGAWHHLLHQLLPVVAGGWHHEEQHCDWLKPYLAKTLVGQIVTWEPEMVQVGIIPSVEDSFRKIRTILIWAVISDLFEMTKFSHQLYCRPQLFHLSPWKAGVWTGWKSHTIWASYTTTIVITLP